MSQSLQYAQRVRPIITGSLPLQNGHIEATLATFKYFIEVYSTVRSRKMTFAPTAMRSRLFGLSTGTLEDITDVLTDSHPESVRDDSDSNSTETTWPCFSSSPSSPEPAQVFATPPPENPPAPTPGLFTRLLRKLAPDVALTRSFSTSPPPQPSPPSSHPSPRSDPRSGSSTPQTIAGLPDEDVPSLDSSLASLSHIVLRPQKPYSDLDAECRINKQLHADLCDDLLTVKRENAALAQENTALKTQVEELEMRVERMEQREFQIAPRIRVWELMEEGLEEEVAFLRESVKEKDEEVEKLRESVKGKDRKIERLQQDVDEYKVIVESEEKRLAGLEFAQEESEKFAEQNVELREMVDEREDWIAATNKHLDEREAHIAQLQELVDQREAHIVQLQKHMESLAKQHEQYHQQHNETFISLTQEDADKIFKAVTDLEAKVKSADERAATLLRAQKEDRREYKNALKEKDAWIMKLVEFGENQICESKENIAQMEAHKKQQDENQLMFDEERAKAWALHPAARMEAKVYAELPLFCKAVDEDAGTDVGGNVGTDVETVGSEDVEISKRADSVQGGQVAPVKR